MSHEKVGSIRTYGSGEGPILYERKQRGISLPYDQMSKEERATLSGPVKEYNLKDVEQLIVKVQIRHEALYKSDVTIELPKYMSDEELKAHMKDLENRVSTKRSFEQAMQVVEEMGFDVLETESGFPKYPSEMKCELSSYEVEKGVY